MTAERGASLAPASQEVHLGDTTIIRRVKRFTPELVKRWSWFAGSDSDPTHQRVFTDVM
jgi:hypothetical protein